MSINKSPSKPFPTPYVTLLGLQPNIPIQSKKKKTFTDLVPNLAYERSNRPGSSVGYTRCSRSHCPSWERASRSQDLALQGRVRDSLMVRMLV